MARRARRYRRIAVAGVLFTLTLGACGGGTEGPQPRTSSGAAARTAVGTATAFDAAHAPKLAVVVAAKDGSSSSIALVDADGRVVRTLTDAKRGTFDYLPRWSPDGNRLAFIRETGDGDRDALVVVDEAGAERELLSLPPDGVDFLGGVPRWSPDGDSVALDPYAVVECSPTKPFALRLAVARADGGGSRDLPALPQPSVLVFVSQIEWSRDGKELLYVVNHDEEDPVVPGVCRGMGKAGSELYAVAVDGSAPRPLRGYAEWELAPSPDGAEIALVGCEDDSCSLQTLAADGSGDVRTVTEVQTRWASLAWPPGNEILHTDFEALKASDVRTGTIRTVATWPELPDAGASEILALSRDGKRVAVGYDESALHEDRPQRVFVIDLATGAIQPVTFRSPTGLVGKPGSGAHDSVAVFLP
jgi:dipeptidyl aminopeptidase/acylaminoacyl peptidase